MCWPCWGVTSVTLSELSLRNARRQAKDYLVYFVTIVLAASLMYAFNGLVFSREIQDLTVMMDAMPLILVLTSIAVVCIIGWLVQYTMAFMLARRSRELGTYILIGLENRQVARLFFLENLAVGGVALALGVLLGNLLFQALRAITLALFGVPYSFSFAFSLKALLLTMGYFALIYLFALWKSRRRIRKMKISQLIDFDRQNEGQFIRKGRARRRIFVVSIVLGAIGSVLIMLRSLPLGILGAFCIIAFLYGFFLSFSSGVPAWFDQRAERKYKGRRLLIYRALSAKLATMGVVMATIALLFTATLISEGSGLVFHAMFQSRNEQTTCFDLYIASSGRGEDPFGDYLAYLDETIPEREAWRYHIYEGGDTQVTDYIKANADYFTEFDYDTVMKASDYAALRALLGYPEAAQAPGTYLVHCMTYLGGLMEGYGQPVTVGGATLTPGGVYTEHFTQSLWDGNGRGFILVVPDEAAQGLPVSHSAYAAMTDVPVKGALFQALRTIRDERDTDIDGYDTIFAKAAVEEENAASYAMIVFPLYYLALVLTMVAATILTIQQLSEAGRYRRQFELLRKLGMERREMEGALRGQFAIYYTMPAVPPLLIGVPFIAGLGGILDPGILTGPAHLLAIVGVALGLFLLIYLVYILMAYTSMKRNVLPE